MFYMPRLPFALWNLHTLEILFGIMTFSLPCHCLLLREKLVMSVRSQDSTVEMRISRDLLYFLWQQFLQEEVVGLILKSGKHSSSSTRTPYLWKEHGRIRWSLFLHSFHLLRAPCPLDGSMVTGCGGWKQGRKRPVIYSVFFIKMRKMARKTDLLPSLINKFEYWGELWMGKGDI